MHLVSVTMQGFKSFPDRTEIKFHPGVTAIVGPNGSGKSNVTDAIRWVLGEQSAKTLRGSKMEDVIFAGTELRRPLSYCEVTLRLDNQDYVLPIDSGEVEVSRRLYRSGESRYLINRENCRLKDIVDLFLDTGIGREGYSIVAQGRIDEILSNKSEDRRRIFDEAAGISRYKNRRDEARRKLEATEREQERAEDLLREIKRQLKPLERQASEARQYLKLQEEYQALDLALIFAEMDRYEDEIRNFDEVDDSMASDLASGDRELASGRSALDEANREAKALADAEDALVRRREASRERLSDQRARIQLLTARLGQLQEQETARKERLAHAEARLKELDEARRQYTEDLDAKTARHQSLSATLEAAEKALEEARAKREAKRAEERAREEDRRTLERHVAEQERRLAVMEQEDDQSRRRDASRREEHEAIEAELAEAKAELETLHKDRRAAGARRDEVQQQVTNLQQRYETSTALAQEAEDKLRRLEAEESQRTYRLQTLEALRDRYEGYRAPVRQLLQSIEDEPIREKVHGPLGDLIQVSEGYETAISVALGGSIQHVVVDDTETAGTLIRRLKDARMGRVTFLPLSDILARPLQADARRQAEAMPGFIGAASELVRYDGAVEAAVINTLGRTVVVDTLETAQTLAKRSGYRLRIVTVDGEIIVPGGALTGGSRGHRDSLLSRPREIDELNQQAASMSRALEDATADVRKQRMAAAAVQHELGEQTEALRDYEASSTRIDSRLEQAEARVGRLRETLRNVEAEAEADDDARRALDEERRTIRDALTAYAAEEEALEASLRSLDTAIDALTSVIAEARQTVADTRAEYAATRAELQAAQGMLMHFERETKQHREVLDAYRDAHGRDENLEAQIRNEREAAETEVTTLEQTLETLIGEREAIRRQREAAEARSVSLRRELQDIRDRRQALEVRRVRLQERHARTKEKLNAVRNRLWEEYEMTFQDREAWIREDLDEAAAGERVKELREAIRKLGTVNVRAVDELRELSERHRFMETQIADIEASREELETLIRKIMASMHEAFKESFIFIREQFKLVFAELFNGGEADIVLEDRDDMLNSGIEIKASPPGKKLQNMLLLSGGERTLAAIALIFALQRLRPAPFCVLDEVEAALDEANIYRFNEYVRKQADTIQFILVTHRKGTMEAADRLYGVTMQEHGVSQILSLKLST